MAVRYAVSVRTVRMQAIADGIDSDASAGYLEICSAGYAVVLAKVVFAKPCGTVSAGVLTFDLPKSEVAADNSGTAAVARMKNGAGVTIVDQLTVGHSGGSEHVILNQTDNAVVAGQPVTVLAGSFTHSDGS